MHQGPTGADVVLAPDTQGMSRCWSRHLLAARPAGADGVPDRCPKQHKHQRPTGADVVPARCPHQKRQESMLVQASARNKASLVLMVCEIGALRSRSMCLDCSVHLGAPRPHRCRCWASTRHTRHEPMLVEASVRNMARWCRWCARQASLVLMLCDAIQSIKGIK